MSKRIVVCLAVVAGLSGLGITRPGQGDDGPKKVALLVGVNQYRTRILVDKPLQYAERDVEELAGVLKGQGFEIRTLVGPLATKEGIEAALGWVLKGREASDLVVLGFAGHGVQMPLVDDEGKPVLDQRDRLLSDSCLRPVNAVFDKVETMISLTRLFDPLEVEGGSTWCKSTPAATTPTRTGRWAGGCGRCRGTS